MTATITISTNAEGTHRLDLDDVIISGESLMDFLVYYLFDEDEGLHASLPEEDKDMRELFLRESTYLIDEVSDDDDLAEKFVGTKTDGTKSFDLYEYSQVRDLIDKPSSTYTVEAITAYMEWAGEWSQSDFESSYEGQYSSDKEFVRSKVELNDCPDHLRPYIDWDQLASDEMANYTEQDGFYFSCM